MFIEAVLKCDVDNTPYRVYINNELITERYYTIIPDTVSNTLRVQLVNSDNYDIKVESLTDVAVTLDSYCAKEKINEN
jgi:hypothetical protein